jgi:hypothetical protein
VKCAGSALGRSLGAENCWVSGNNGCMVVGTGYVLTRFAIVSV